MWRVAFLLVLVFLPRSGLAQGYESKELAEAAAAYRQELRDSIPANQRQPAMIPRLRRDADEDYRAKRYSRAIVGEIIDHNGQVACLRHIASTPTDEMPAHPVRIR